MTWKQKLVIHKNFFGKGYGELTNLRFFVQFYILLEIWFTTRGWKVNHVLLIMAFVAAILFFWLVGWAWDRIGMFHVENEFGNKRNGLMLEINERLKKLEKQKQKI